MEGGGWGGEVKGGCCLAELGCAIFAFRVLVRMQLKRELHIRGFHLRIFVGGNREPWQKGSTDADGCAGRCAATK
jgi:hypothetical protein